MAERHPFDMAPAEFMALPEHPYTDGPLPTPLRSKHDPTGMVDQHGRWWVPVQREDGSWARQEVIRA